MRCLTMKGLAGRTAALARGAGAVIVAGALLPLALSGCSSGTGISAGPLASSIAHTFANLYELQQSEQGNPHPSVASLHSHAACQKGIPSTPQDGAGEWLCEITYFVAGPAYPVIAKYNVDVQTNGCYAGDGDGPTSVNGSPTITGPHYVQVNNPLFLVDGCFPVT